MSKSKSNKSSRKAGGWRVYGLSQQFDFDVGGFLRKFNKIGNYSTEQIVMKISYFLKECEKTPSLAKEYGLSERELNKLKDVWGDWTQPKSKEDMEKIKKAVDSFLMH
jgi:hypothetical protein